MEEREISSVEGETKSFVPTQRFDHLTYWNHDVSPSFSVAVCVWRDPDLTYRSLQIVPSSCDVIPRCVDFLDMAEAIHYT